MTGRPEPRFRKGDAVTVVDQPYINCPFYWTHSMDEFCGAKTEVISLNWSTAHRCFAYYIAVDNGRFKWCENCFETPGSEVEIEESDVDFGFLFL